MTWLTRGRRTRHDVAARAVVLGGLALFVVLVYVAVAIGGAALLGQARSPDSPDLVLSVLATAVVAIAFDPVQTRLEELAGRLTHDGGRQPYDVLRRFFATVSGSYRAEELPLRMARVLAEGTGATWTQVWLAVGDRPTLAATWPPGATREPGPGAPDPREHDVPGRRSLPVRHGSELLGVLVVQERADAPLTQVEERLFTGLAGQAGLVLRGARLRAELERRFTELSRRAEELRVSRRRLVDVQDARRRTLERDIHDGAQQHLVALAVNLRLAQTLAERSPARARTLLVGQQAATAAAIETLVQLAGGIYPPLLAEGGLAAALRGAAATSQVPVEVVEQDLGRYAPNVEAAAYFGCLEAVQNAVKHAGASRIRVELCGRPDGLVLVVTDDGQGFDPATTSPGAGLANIRDRIESVGGTVHTESAPGRGTSVRAVLPVHPLVAPTVGS